MRSDPRRYRASAQGRARGTSRRREPGDAGVNRPCCEAVKMLSLTRPSEARIRQFLAQQRGLPYSYPDVGSSLGKPPAGYVLDHHRVRLGEGPQVFERALRGVAGLGDVPGGLGRGLPSGFAHRGRDDRRPPRPRARPLGPFRLPDRPASSRSMGRSSRTGSPTAPCRGTRSAARSGSRSGGIARRARSGTTCWRSRGPRTSWRLGYPLIRRIQRRFAPASLRAMAHAVKGGEP